MFETIRSISNSAELGSGSDDSVSRNYEQGILARGMIVLREDNKEKPSHQFLHKVSWYTQVEGKFKLIAISGFLPVQWTIPSWVVVNLNITLFLLVASFELIAFLFCSIFLNKFEIENHF